MTKRKNNIPPAFQFYPGDFLRDQKVMLMSLEELGAYIKLLCSNWLEGSIPDDINKLARLCSITPGEMEQIWTSLKPCFKPKGKRYPGMLINSRLETERKKQRAFRKKQSENANKRWDKSEENNDDTCGGNTTAIPARAVPEACSSSSIFDFDLQPSVDNIDSIDGNKDEGIVKREMLKPPKKPHEVVDLWYEAQNKFGFPNSEKQAICDGIRYHNTKAFNEAMTALQDLIDSGKKIDSKAKYFTKVLWHEWQLREETA